MSKMGILRISGISLISRMPRVNKGIKIKDNKDTHGVKDFKDVERCQGC